MAPRRVLVVDDEPGLRETLAANLELEGFVVTEVPNAQQALERALQEPFDLVVTDIQMPGETGIDLFHALRRAGKQMPVVLMTGFALEQLVDGALEAGVFAVLHKPFDVQHALKTAANAVRAPTVLVVDDVATVAESTKASLEAAGVRAAMAVSGAQALEVVAMGTVDVCIVDLAMPDMTGAELARRLRKAVPDVMLIVVSGQDAPALVHEVAALGMHRFFKKPARIPELVRSIANARGAAQKRKAAE